MFAFAAVNCVAPLPPWLLAMTCGIVVRINLWPMAETGVPPRDAVIALMFAAAMVGVAASTFGGGGVGVCNNIALLGESWV